jgi:hypothetical protein
MFCRICGQPIAQGAKICSYCGTPVETGPSYPSYPTYSATEQPPTPTPYSQTPAAPTNYNPSYENNPYYMQQYDPYMPPVSLPQPPPIRQGSPQGQARKATSRNIAIIIGSVVLVLLVIAGTFLIVNSKNNTSVQADHKATATVSATKAASVPDPYDQSINTLLMNDPMHDNLRGYRWDQATMNGASASVVAQCGFTHNAYHVTATGPQNVTCDPEASQFSLKTVVFEADEALLRGDAAGLKVRLDQQNGSGYLFEIGVQSSYALYKLNPQGTNPAYVLINSGTNASIKTGSQVNTLAIVARDKSFSAYANGQFIYGFQDNSYTSGQVGLYGISEKGPLDIAISRVRIWS